MTDRFRYRTIKTNGIDLHLTEQGEGKPVIFVHGFPELGRSWRHQLPALAEAGYHAIAPDMRGYGKSSTPKEVEAYNVIELTNDLCGLLDDLGVEQAAFVGHDWGAWAMWFMALLHPGRVASVTNLSVPYMQRAPSPPVPFMRQIFGDNFFYIVYFQDIGPAEDELGKDVRRTVRKFAWSVSGEAAERAMENPSLIAMKVGEGGFLDMLTDPPDDASMQWFTKEDEDHFVENFERTGYFGPVSWYRNIDRNWELTPQLDGAKVEVPCSFVAGANDPVIRMSPPDGMKDMCTNLLEINLIAGAGHWVQWERPAEVNASILKLLRHVGY